MGDTSLLAVFKNEASEIIEQIEADLIQLEEENDPDVINSLFRSFHTLKGSSGITGLTDVSHFTHHIENLCDLIRGNKISVNRELIDLILQSVDWIKVAIFGGDDSYDLESEQAKLLHQISAYLPDHTDAPLARREGSAASTDTSTHHYFRIKVNFKKTIFEYGIDPLIIMEDLFDLGEIVEKKAYRNNVPLLSEMDPEKCYVWWRLVLKTTYTLDDIREIFIFVQEDNDIEIDDITKLYEKDLKKKPDEDKKLGDILVQKGIISEQELEEVLKVQERENRRVGEIIIEQGYATEKDLKQALGTQKEIRSYLEHSTVRVDTGKLDNLLNLLGEIVIGQASISRLAKELSNEENSPLQNAIYSLDRVTREFQEQIMSIRMIPVGPSFTVFKRFVRDIAHQKGKEIKLQIQGEDTELDKTVVEKISDPLKHMIRNSIDHGIESKEERLQVGKPEAGTILLNAYHQEGHVFIEVKDDGQGLNLEHIRQKAIKKGLLQPNEKVSDEDLISYIFMPGFSTAAEISDLSGRGVGMDVVKSNISALRGTIDVQTEYGAGTTMRIKLPLTLAIIEGMLCRVGEYIYIIPLLSIVESIQPKKEDIKTIKQRGEVVHVRGEYVSFIRLHEFFEIESVHKNPWEALVMVVETEDSRLAIMIDELIGQQQIVIKSLDAYITQNRSVSGAAILGDGSVALILDIHGLLSHVTKLGKQNSLIGSEV